MIRRWLLNIEFISYMIYHIEIYIFLWIELHDTENCDIFFTYRRTKINCACQKLPQISEDITD